MDPIPFERASISEAKAVIDQGQGKRVDVAPPPEVDWAAKRTAGQDTDKKLSPACIAWLTKLPRELRPMQLAVQFPRIANNMALVWPRIGPCTALFDELLIVKRGTRKGFPMKVLSELHALKIHKDNEIQKGHIKPSNGIG
jgi:hypothetical protein